MKNNALVSIIVPVYNSQKYLSSCIKSLINQTYENIEIILVNDGSTDISLEIMSKFQKKDNRIVVIDKKNEGSSISRKKGLDIARGEYIVFIDSDDLIDKKTIELSLNFAKKNKCDIVLFKMSRLLFNVNVTKGWDKVFPKTFNHQEFMEKYFISFFGKSDFPVTLCGKLYKKDLFDGIVFDNIFTGDDLCVNIQLLTKVEKFGFLDKFLYKYRIGGGTSKFNPRLLSDYSVIKKYQFQQIEKYSLGNEYSLLVNAESANVFSTFVHMYLFEKNNVTNKDYEFIYNAFSETDFIKQVIVYFENKDLNKLIINITIRDNILELLNFDAKKYVDKSFLEIQQEKNSARYKIKNIIKNLM